MILGVIAGAGVVLFLMWRRERTQSQSKFREMLERAIREKSLSRLDFASLATHCGVSDKAASQTACEIYESFFQKALGDGRIIPSERRKLDALAGAMQISHDRLRQLESKMKLARYRHAVEQAFQHGLPRPEAIQTLESMREWLKLAPEEVQTVKTAVVQPLFHRQLQATLGRGTFSQPEQVTLRNLARAMGTSIEQALTSARTMSLNHYRERFYIYRQDGRFDEQELADLNRIQRFCLLADTDIEAFQVEILNQQLLESIRGGDLPQRKTDKLLEGGEICHWESSCNLVVTRKRTRQGQTILVPETLSGQVTVTSNRIIFISPTRNFEFRPEKIIDLDLFPKGVKVQTSSSQGTGFYGVRSADTFEAILTGLANRRKFKTVHEFSSTRSRHIPSNVKRDVWARDGGLCVQCRAADYLEFDHIIPHSKGGANTVNNIQLLCRRCNQQKSDRI